MDETFPRSPLCWPPCALPFFQRLAQAPAATLRKYLNQKLHIICPSFESSLCVCTFTTNIWMYPYPEKLWGLKHAVASPLNAAPCVKTDPQWPMSGTANQGCFVIPGLGVYLIQAFPTHILSPLSGSRLLLKVDTTQLCGSDSSSNQETSRTVTSVL